ncbi:hypothetical protein CFPU101_16780 [Chroococcus sp. FPU101]|nr:hypothetical protein CFPU101_16780 [Chroococcus sp. FPU101]
MNSEVNEPKQGHFDNPLVENIYDTSNLADTAFTDSQGNANPKLLTSPEIQEQVRKEKEQTQLEMD